MSWADDKAHELMAPIVVYPRDSASFDRVALLVERAIRETIEKCAETAHRARSDGGFMTESGRMVSDRVEAAIRKLGEP